MALTRRELLAGKENEVASFPLGYHLPFHYLGVAAQIEAAKRFLGRSGGNMVVIDIKDESGNMCLEVDHPLAPKAYPSTYGAGLQEPCSGGCKPATKYPNCLLDYLPGPGKTGGGQSRGNSSSLDSSLCPVGKKCGCG